MATLMATSEGISFIWPPSGRLHDRLIVWYEESVQEKPVEPGMMRHLIIDDFSPEGVREAVQAVFRGDD